MGFGVYGLQGLGVRIQGLVWGSLVGSPDSEECSICVCNGFRIAGSPKLFAEQPTMHNLFGRVRLGLGPRVYRLEGVSGLPDNLKDQVLSRLRLQTA